MSSAPNSGERGRFSSQRKAATVLRLLRGEDLELVSRELGVTAATLSGWRDDFLAGGQAALKSRPADDRDDELARLRSKVGELTMDNGLLLQRCRARYGFVVRAGTGTSMGDATTATGGAARPAAGDGVRDQHGDQPQPQGDPARGCHVCSSTRHAASHPGPHTGYRRPGKKQWGSCNGRGACV